MNTLLFQAVTHPRNTRLHPISLGLLYLYCPAAAYWWKAGVEIRPPFSPVWQAVEDYTAEPPRTLRDFLEGKYGLKGLLDEAKKYIEQVKAARQRLPHVTAPELLPTFPGGKLPLRKRFGINKELKRIGDAEGFFAYIRTWAFLVPDWMARVPFQEIKMVTLWAPVRFSGLRSAYWLPVWAFFGKNDDPTKDTPLILGVPPGEPEVIATLYLFAQSPNKHPWERKPQVWGLELTGEVSPVDPFVPAEQAGEALLALGRKAEEGNRPLPAAALGKPAQCRECPFRHLCLEQDGGGWTPQAGQIFKERVR